MRALAFALLLVLAGGGAALAQRYDSDRSYSDRDNNYYQQRDRSDQDARDRYDNERRANDERRAYDERRSEQEAYQRGRRDADRQQQDQNNNFVAPLERLFNNNNNR